MATVPVYSYDPTRAWDTLQVRQSPRRVQPIAADAPKPDSHTRFVCISGWDISLYLPLDLHGCCSRELYIPPPLLSLQTHTLKQMDCRCHWATFCYMREIFLTWACRRKWRSFATSSALCRIRTRFWQS